MTTLPMLLGLVAVCTAAAGLAVRPAAVTTRERRRERRVRALTRHSQWVSCHDVDARMAESLSPFEVGLVNRWAAERDVPPSLLWQWVTRHGAEALLLCLAAGLTTRELVEHLDDLSALDRRSLELQAELRALGATIDEVDGVDDPGNGLGHGTLGSASWD